MSTIATEASAPLRYESSLVNCETYPLHCQRFIELYPISSGMTINPLDHGCSSDTHIAIGRVDPLIHPHSRIRR